MDIASPAGPSGALLSGGLHGVGSRRLRPAALALCEPRTFGLGPARRPAGGRGGWAARADGGGHDLQNVAVACPAHHGAVHDGRLRLWREANGQLQTEWTQVPVPSADEWFDTPLDVLQWEEMTTEDAAFFLRVSPARAKALLEHAERSCDVVRTVSDRWCRHGALAAELGEVPVAWV